MRRDTSFTFLCNETERQQLAQLAHTLGRSQGDTVRCALRKLTAETYRLEPLPIVAPSSEPTPDLPGAVT
jgi:hypothetical protein